MLAIVILELIIIVLLVCFIYCNDRWNKEYIMNLGEEIKFLRNINESQEKINFHQKNINDNYEEQIKIHEKIEEKLAEELKKALRGE